MKLCRAGLHEMAGTNLMDTGHGYVKCRACVNRRNRVKRARVAVRRLTFKIGITSTATLDPTFWPGPDDEVSLP